MKLNNKTLILSFILSSFINIQAHLPQSSNKISSNKTLDQLKENSKKQKSDNSLKFSLSSSFNWQISSDKFLLESGSDIFKTRSDNFIPYIAGLILGEKYSMSGNIRFDITKEFSQKFNKVFAGFSVMFGNKIEHYLALNEVLKIPYKTSEELVKEALNSPLVQNALGDDNQLSDNKALEENMFLALKNKNPNGDIIVKESFSIFFGPHFGLNLSKRIKLMIALGPNVRALTTSLPLVMESIDMFCSRFSAIANLSYKIHDTISVSLQAQYEAPITHTISKNPLYSLQLQSGPRLHLGLALTVHFN